eukprot:CAMPEP_0206156584 /NCGR_PEP_ID=MMETSP1474-20131121/3107_1 /ASSEMBLY_ACC=CAM_ASM_001110 /TAXON_ID=97495 /ORGANISM="Imantonia sp., Strain RCC918" /LENGTH=223 /DNA_ID=CAMNT_0053555719 /DNA_START=212 /DNA_END=880 /DNA_ORIENTATION=+
MANKIWLGTCVQNGKMPLKPRAGENGRIKQFMEAKYKHKKFYVPPSQVMDVPQEDLSDTGILDSIPTPPSSRAGKQRSNVQGNSTSFFDSPNATSFFDSNNQPSTSGNQSFFPEEQKQNTPKVASGGGLFDFDNALSSNPATSNPAPSNSGNSLLDIDFSGASTNTPQPASHGSFGSSNALGGFDFASNQPQGSVQQQGMGGFNGDPFANPSASSNSFGQQSG